MSFLSVFRRERTRVNNLKMRFERKLFKDFQEWQKSAFTYFVDLVEDKGHSVVTLSREHYDSLEKLLLSHYSEIMDAFYPGILEIKEKENEETKPYLWALLLSIRKVMSDIIYLGIKSRVRSIVATTEALGNQSIQIFKMTPDSVYSKILATKLAGRTTTVSITETTWIAESVQRVALDKVTPLIETANKSQFRVLQDVSPNITLKSIKTDDFFDLPLSDRAETIAKLKHPIKQWVSMKDGKTRESHSKANGTILPLNVPFDLPGGKLQYPSDTSLGASIEETINCRCWATYK